jgi:hypothetical protein
LTKPLNKRLFTQQEIEHYVVLDDPVVICVPLSVGSPDQRYRKLMVTMALCSECCEKIVESLGKLGERGHFSTVEKIMLEYHFRNGKPFVGGSQYRV